MKIIPCKFCEKPFA